MVPPSHKRPAVPCPRQYQHNARFPHRSSQTPSVLGSSRRLWAEVLPRIKFSNRGCHHVNPASFVYGTNCAPFPLPAILPSTLSILRLVPYPCRSQFSFPGVASMPVMLFRFIDSLPRVKRIAKFGEKVSSESLQTGSALSLTKFYELNLTYTQAFTVARNPARRLAM
jgi:hypothetical protein